MACLLKVLSDMLQNPQLPSHIHIWPKPKVKLGPTDSFYPAPPSLDVIATATNPRKISLTNRDLGLTEMSDRSHRGCNVNSLFPFCNISVPPKWAIGPTEFTWPTLWLAYYQNRSHRVCVIGHTEITLCPNPNHIGVTELHFGPTKNPNGHIVCWIGLTEFNDSVPPSLVDCV